MTIADANDKIAEKVVGGYKAVENAVTSGYKKVEDKFVDKFLRKDGETIEEAKARIEQEQAERKEKQEAEAKERAEKIAKMSGTKTTAEIRHPGGFASIRKNELPCSASSGCLGLRDQADIKEKYGL